MCMRYEFREEFLNRIIISLGKFYRSCLKVNVHHRIRTTELEIFLFAIEKAGDVRSESVIS